MKFGTDVDKNVLIVSKISASRYLIIKVKWSWVKDRFIGIDLQIPNMNYI